MKVVEGDDGHVKKVQVVGHGGVVHHAGEAHSVSNTVLLCGQQSLFANGAVAAESPAELAKQAASVLKSRCYSCHGESGANEGGFNYSLNRKRLVRELVVPGSADESKLLQRVVKGEMPPDGDRLPKEEIDTLKK